MAGIGLKMLLTGPEETDTKNRATCANGVLRAT